MVSAQDMPSVFERLSSPKTWAEDDLRKLIDVIIAEKAITHTPGDLAKMSLGEQNGSPFTQRIAEAPPPPPKKFTMPKFNIYNRRTDLADHLIYYQHERPTGYLIMM